MSGQRKASSSRASKKPSTSGPVPKPGSAPRRSSRTPPKKKRTKWQIAGRVVGWLSVLFLLMVLGGIGAFVYAYQHISIPNPNADFLAQTSFVYYADGKTPIGHFATQNRSDVSLADLPQSVQWAVLSAEDRSFETNVGFDPKGIARATINDLMGNSLQGASTITQQYVKILYLNQERTISRKIQEGILAIKINQEESKDQILQGYLNTVYFGRGAYGIQAAAQAYFGVNATQLNVKQAAVLASVINDPNNLDPANGAADEQALLARYRYVLDGMVQMGNLDPAKAAKYSAALPKFPSHIQDVAIPSDQGGHLMTMVKQQLLSQGFTESQIDTGGLRIVTTFDRKAMKAATKAVAHQRPKGFSDKRLHVGLASVEPGTGALRAIYAGQDFSTSSFNWATAAEPSGSTFKPFSLAAGLEDGYSLMSQFQGNSPINVGGTPFENEGPGSGNDYGKHVTLLRGLEESINTVYIDLVASMDNGPQRVFDVATKLGIPKDAPGLSKTEVGVTLGSASVTPVEMAAAYAGFANRGVAADPYFIEQVSTADGQVLYQHDASTRNAVPSDVAADVAYALQQVVQHGTGTAAIALGRPAGGKTGTATNSAGHVTSAWFVGFTPQLSTAVMYVRGNGTGRLDGWLPSYYGASYPAHTWTAYMLRALKGDPVLTFPAPAHIKATRTDHPTPTPKPTATPTPTATDTATPTPTATDTATPTPTTTVPPLPTGTVIPSP